MAAILYLSRADSRRVDELAIKEFGMSGVVLMENAGRNCAEWIIKHFQRSPIIIFCGNGNNGGDGFVIARYLANAGYDVELLLTTRIEELKGDACLQVKPVQAMGIPIYLVGELLESQLVEKLTSAELVLDCLVGTGLDRPVKQELGKLIELINNHAKSVVAIDIPSGLHADTGKPLGMAIKAAYTLTMVSQKMGFKTNNSREYTGKISVVDIGIPHKLFKHL